MSPRYRGPDRRKPQPYRHSETRASGGEQVTVVRDREWVFVDNRGREIGWLRISAVAGSGGTR